MRALLLSACAVLAVACNSDNAPQVPTVLEASVATTIAASAGAEAIAAPAVTLRDAVGHGIAGVWVHFTATGGGTVANDSLRTNTQGVAAAGTWTLGTAAGVQTVVATAAGLAPVIFTAQVAAGAAVRIVAVSPDAQTGTVNTSVPTAPAVRVVDRYDNPVAGALVTFSTVTGNGTIAGGQQTTGTNGVATVDAWTLGTKAGVQQARAEVTGVPTAVTINATATAAAPATITIVGGNDASGVAGSSLATAGALPSVRVADQYDNPVANALVAFTPGANSGTVTPATVSTNEQGIAALTDWLLGAAGTAKLVATVAGLVNAQAAFTVSVTQPSLPATPVTPTTPTTPTSSQFNIEVRYVEGAPSARQQLAVSRAVDRWKSVIAGNSGTSKIVLSAGSCGRSWMPAVNETVTNVLIFAKIGKIDGINGVLGNSSVCVLHSSTQLTVVGTMYFDSEDLTSLEGTGLIDVVMLHEMGHVLGIGSQWSSKGFLAGRGGTDPIFTGSNALSQFALIGGSTYSGRPVPVENAGGSGTADVHWRESVFHSELMTGYLNNGTNPMSRLTIGSLQDLGYQVSLTAADNFTLAPSLLMSPFTPTISLGNDVVETEIITMDRNGKRGVPKATSKGSPPTSPQN